MQFDSPRKLINDNEKAFVEYFLIIGCHFTHNSFVEKSIYVPEIIDSYPTDIDKAKSPFISNIASVLI